MSKEKEAAKAAKQAEKEAAKADETPRLERTIPTEDTGSIAGEVVTDTKADEDYLQQYQYGKELPLGDIRTNPSKGGKAEVMKKSLLAQPRVSILIPVPEGSDSSVPQSVTLNGYRLDLPKNVYVEVPKQVAEIIMQSQRQTVQALNQFRGEGK